MHEPALSRIDVLDVCAVMLQRCGLTSDELARHMGRSELPKPKPHAAPAAAPAPAGTAQLTPRLIEVLDLCRCPDGLCVQELQRLLNIGMQTAFAHLDNLRVFGLLTWVKIPGIRAARYFSNPAHAQAWQASHEDGVTQAEARTRAAAAARVAAKAAAAAHRLAAKEARQSARDAARSAKAKAKSKPSAPPVVLKAAPARQEPPPATKPSGEATNPNGVEPTRAVTPVDTRYFLAADEPLTGGFSTTRPGINPLTGKAWGQ